MYYIWKSIIVCVDDDDDNMWQWDYKWEAMTLNVAKSKSTEMEGTWWLRASLKSKPFEFSHFNLYLSSFTQLYFYKDTILASYTFFLFHEHYFFLSFALSIAIVGPGRFKNFSNAWYRAIDWIGLLQLGVASDSTVLSGTWIKNIISTTTHQNNCNTLYLHLLHKT